jgi:hypothetical protein
VLWWEIVKVSTTYGTTIFPAKIAQMIDAKSLGAYASRVWRSASRRMLLHAAQFERVGRAVLCAPLPVVSASMPDGGQETDRPTAPRNFVKESAVICVNLRIKPSQQNFDYYFENALTFNARQMPFNSTILLQFGYHAKPHLTHCGSALCAICADKSALPCKTKTPAANRYPSIACNVMQAKSREKIPSFFSGRFDGKTLENQGKTAKKHPQFTLTILQLLTRFFRAKKVNGSQNTYATGGPGASRSIKVRATVGLNDFGLRAMGQWTTGLKTALDWNRNFGSLGAACLKQHKWPFW